MKRTISMLLALCLALSLCGAALAAEAPEDTAPPAAVTENEPAPEPVAEPAPAAPIIPEDIRIIQWPPQAEEPEEESGEEAEESGEESGETETAEEPEESAEEETKPSYVYTGLDPEESVGNIIVSNGLSWEATSCAADRVEIEPGAIVEADHPVVILFTESDTVQDGETRGNIRFIQDYDEVIAIVHTNDTHGYLKSEPYVKGLADQLRDSGAYSLVLTVSAGNIFTGGHAAAHAYNGEYIPYVMGGVYDFFTWGGDDVRLPNGDQSAFFLSILAESAGVTPLVANRTALKHMDVELYTAAYEPAVGTEEFAALYDNVLSLNEEGGIDYSALRPADYALEKGDNVLDDGALAETENGTVIGLFGLSCQSDGEDGNIFVNDRSTLETAQIMTDALRAEGANVVVGIGSTGWWGEDSDETGSNDANAAQVAKNTRGLDAFIDGGTQSVIYGGGGWMNTAGGAMTLVNETGGNGEGIGVMYIVLKDGEIIGLCGENILPREDGSYPGIVPDAEVWARVARVYARLTEDGYNTAYGSTEEFLNGERLVSGNAGGSVLANETNLGDLVTDGMLWIARQYWTGDSATVALYPGSWIGTSLRAGSITLADAMAVFSQPMKLVYKEYTNRELVGLLTDMCANLGQDSGTMYQTAGLVCTYDRDTMELATLAIDDILYYERGVYMMDENQTVRCVTVVPADEEVPEDTVIAESNTELARLWCEFLQAGDFTVHTNEIHPDWRVYPAPLPESEDTAEEAPEA